MVSQADRELIRNFVTELRPYLETVGNGVQEFAQPNRDGVIVGQAVQALVMIRGAGQILMVDGLVSIAGWLTEAFDIIQNNPDISPSEAVRRLNGLSSAMEDFLIALDSADESDPIVLRARTIFEAIPAYGGPLPGTGKLRTRTNLDALFGDDAHSAPTDRLVVANNEDTERLAAPEPFMPSGPLAEYPEAGPTVRLQSDAITQPVGDGPARIVPIPPQPTEKLPEVDPELREIFEEEAAEIIISFGECARVLAQAPRDFRVVDRLRRDAHTLKGAANMTGFPVVAQIGAAIERLLDEHLDRRKPIARDTLELIVVSWKMLRAMMPHLNNLSAFTSPSNSVVQRANVLREQIASAAAEAETLAIRHERPAIVEDLPTDELVLISVAPAEPQVLEDLVVEHEGSAPEADAEAEEAAVESAGDFFEPVEASVDETVDDELASEPFWLASEDADAEDIASEKPQSEPFWTPGTEELMRSAVQTDLLIADLQAIADFDDEYDAELETTSDEPFFSAIDEAEAPGSGLLRDDNDGDDGDWLSESSKPGTDLLMFGTRPKTEPFWSREDLPESEPLNALDDDEPITMDPFFEPVQGSRPLAMVEFEPLEELAGDYSGFDLEVTQTDVEVLVDETLDVDTQPAPLVEAVIEPEAAVEIEPEIVEQAMAPEPVAAPAWAFDFDAQPVEHLQPFEAAEIASDEQPTEDFEIVTDGELLGSDQPFDPAEAVSGDDEFISEAVAIEPGDEPEFVETAAGDNDIAEAHEFEPVIEAEPVASIYPDELVDALSFDEPVVEVDAVVEDIFVEPADMPLVSEAMDEAEADAGEDTVFEAEPFETDQADDFAEEPALEADASEDGLAGPSVEELAAQAEEAVLPAIASDVAEVMAAARLATGEPRLVDALIELDVEDGEDVVLNGWPAPEDLDRIVQDDPVTEIEPSADSAEFDGPAVDESSETEQVDAAHEAAPNGVDVLLDDILPGEADYALYEAPSEPAGILLDFDEEVARLDDEPDVDEPTFELEELDYEAVLDEPLETVEAVVEAESEGEPDAPADDLAFESEFETPGWLDNAGGTGLLQAEHLDLDDDLFLEEPAEDVAGPAEPVVEAVEAEWHSPASDLLGRPKGETGSLRGATTDVLDLGTLGLDHFLTPQGSAELSSALLDMAFAMPLDGALDDDAAAETSISVFDESSERALEIEMFETFAIECEDHIDTLNRAAMQLDRDPGATEPIIDIKRALHTLKGAAAAAEFDEVSQRAHQLEDSLATLERIGGLRDRTFTAELFEAIEGIEAQLAARKDKLFGTAEDDRQGTTIRVDIERVDTLLNTVGELVVNRAGFEQRLERLADRLADLSTAAARLQRSSYLLEREAHSEDAIGRLLRGELTGSADSILIRPTGGDWDELEMDRYTEFDRLIRQLAEVGADVGTAVGEIAALRGDLETVSTRQRRLTTTLQDELMGIRMVPISSLAPRLYRVVRRAASRRGKEVSLVLEGGETPFDKQLLDSLSESLLHLLRNAVDHGIEDAHVRRRLGKPEAGTIRIRAYRDGSEAVIEIIDDGAGIDHAAVLARAAESGLHVDRNLSRPEALALIFESGVSTRGEIDDISGRGVGLDIVRQTMARYKGRVAVDSVPERGTVFSLRLPVMLSVTQAFLVSAGHGEFAIPVANVEYVVDRVDQPLTQIGDSIVVETSGQIIPVVDVSARLGGETTPVMERKSGWIMVSEIAGRRWALVIDALHSQQEIVVKPLGRFLRALPGIMGATILGNGDVALIVDVPTLLGVDTLVTRLGGASAVAEMLDSGAETPATEALPHEQGRTILIVDDSLSVRRVVSRTLERHGWVAVLARDGVEALEMLEHGRIDIVLTDIEMPRMDGFELLSAVRSRGALAHLPVIVLTSRSGEKHRERSFDLGADAYLVKPFQEQELIEIVEDAALVTARR